jgi:hypothetical protein
MSLLELSPAVELPQHQYKTLNKPSFIEVSSKCEEDELFNDTLEENLKVLRMIELPKWFSLEQLDKYFKDTITEDLKKSPLFTEQQKIYKCTRDIKKYLFDYFKQIYNHEDNIIQFIEGRMLQVSNNFMNSDLPPFFLRIINLSFKTEERYDIIFKKRIRREEVKLKMYLHDFKKFRRVVDGHNAWVENIDTFLNDMKNQRLAILWYIEIWNSRKIDELFKDKTLKMSALDNNVFEKMLLQLESMTNEVRRHLISLDKEEFVKSFDARDPTTSLFADSIRALNELTT